MKLVHVLCWRAGHTVRRYNFAHYRTALLFAMAVISAADTPQTAAPAPNPSNQVTPDRLENEIAELRKKVEKPPKDAWDKLTATSGLASGILVALIGFYATNVYNRRQKQSEILISQIQTVEKFIPHLVSDNEQTKGAALTAISALGNQDLAVRLAAAFKGTGATRALTEIASSGAGTQAGKSARRALGDVLAPFFWPRVVTFHSGGLRRATGFIAWVPAPVAEGYSTPKDLIVTTAHAVEGQEPSQLQVKLPSGHIVSASVVKVDQARDLAVLRAETESLLPALYLSPPARELGETIVALFIDVDGNFRAQLGTFMGLTMQKGEYEDVQRIAVSLRVEPASSGTPVVDRDGQLLGLVQGTDSKGSTYLIPAQEALAFVELARDTS